MEEREELTPQPEPQDGAESADSRRQFINKLVAAAGTFAVAGLLASTDAHAAKKTGGTVADKTWVMKGRNGDSLEALKIDGIKIDGFKIDSHKMSGITEVHKDSTAKTRDVPAAGLARAAGVGFVVSLQGKQLGEALVKAGVIPATANLENARLTIEFSA